MARNKYPEQTVERILDAAETLFLQKGYDKTTIQDIVDNLPGLSRGAIYHHYKSKDEIVEAVADRLYARSDLFGLLRGNSAMPAAQRVKQLILQSLKVHLDHPTFFHSTIRLQDNPRMLVEQLASCQEIGKELTRVMEQGVRDGSIQTQYPQQLTETLLLLFNIWSLPSVWPGGYEELVRRFEYIRYLLTLQGATFFDDEVMEACKAFARLYGPEGEENQTT